MPLMADKEVVKVLDSIARRRRKRIVTGKVRGGKRSEIITVGKQGKYLKYRTPPDPDKVEDIALLPTIRAAIFHAKNGKVEVKKRDFREKVRRRKISTFLCFVLDTSSSMAESEKIAGLRSVLDSLFLDAYQKRDRVALITAHGHKAEVLSKFTSGVDIVKKMADRVKFGGTTPLSLGVSEAIRLVKSKISTESSTVPIMIIITDGMANTPSVQGGDVNEELQMLASDAKELGIRTLVIDVDSDNRAQPLSDLFKAGYFSAKGVAEEVEFVNPAYMEEIEKSLYLPMINRDTGGFLFRNFPENAVDEALERVKSAGIEIESTGCVHHCDPNEPENMCRECSLKYELGILGKKSEPMPVVVIDRDVSPEELKGRIYLKYMLTPSVFRDVNRGLLFIKNVDLLSEESARAIADVLVSGKNVVEWEGNAIEHRVSFSLAGTAESGDIPEVLREFFVSTVDAGEIDEFEMRVRSSLYKNEFEIDPRGFEERMKEKSAGMAEKAKKARELIKDVRVPDEFSEALDKEILEIAKSVCAFDSRLIVEIEDIVEAIRFSSYDVEGSAEKEAYADAIEELMEIPLVNREISLIFRNFPENAVDEALERVKSAGIEIESTGCVHHCDPNEPENMCRECSLKYELGILGKKSEPMPVVVIDRDVSPEELKGRIYLKYMLTPSVFRDVNRGLLFIKNVDLLSEESARAIADVLVSGKNVVEWEGNAIEHRVSFSLAGTAESGDIPEVLREFFVSTVDAGEIDEFEMRAKSVLSSVLSAEKGVSGIRERISAAKGLLPGVQVLDSQMDSIARVCYEMDFEGNSSEVKIVEYSRTIAALEGVNTPENAHILRGIRALSSRMKANPELSESGKAEKEEVMANG